MQWEVERVSLNWVGGGQPHLRRVRRVGCGDEKRLIEQLAICKKGAATSMRGCTTTPYELACKTTTTQEVAVRAI